MPTIAEQWLQQGMEKGRQEGRQEGTARGELIGRIRAYQEILGIDVDSVAALSVREDTELGVLAAQLKTAVAQR
jgi:predicted transposase YdaD